MKGDTMVKSIIADDELPVRGVLLDYIDQYGEKIAAINDCTGLTATGTTGQLYKDKGLGKYEAVHKTWYRETL
jgi:hypothetical protein